MCTKCVRKSKRLGLPIPYGKVKALAQAFYRGQPIPMFWDKAINVAVEAHLSRIQKSISNRHRYNRREEI